MAKKIEDYVTIAEDKLNEIKYKEGNSRFFFLTYDDIKKTFNRYPEDTTIAVTVPEDVQVESLDEQNRLEIILDSSKEMSETTRETMENVNENLIKGHQIYFYSNTRPIGVYLLMNPGSRGRNGENEEENVNRNYDPMFSNGRGSRDNDSSSPFGYGLRSSFMNFNEGFLN